MRRTPTTTRPRGRGPLTPVTGALLAVAALLLLLSSTFLEDGSLTAAQWGTSTALITLALLPLALLTGRLIRAASTLIRRLQAWHAQRRT